MINIFYDPAGVGLAQINDGFMMWPLRKKSISSVLDNFKNDVFCMAAKAPV